MDFDPAGSGANMSSYGAAEVFVLKLNSSGSYVWAKQLTRSSYPSVPYVWAIAVDSSGNVYATGNSPTADFDPGAGTVELSGGFVWKLDSSGSYVWAKVNGGIHKAIALDSSGNVYTTGYFYNTADFDPGAGTANLTSAGVDDVYISKFDSSGNYVWARRMGGTDSDIGAGVAVDSNGNVFSTGMFNGTIDVDPDACSQNLTSGGNRDIYVWKLDSAGILN